MPIGKGKKAGRTAGKSAKAAPARRSAKIPPKQKSLKIKKKSPPAKVAAKVRKVVKTARTAAKKAVSAGKKKVMPAAKAKVKPSKAAAPRQAPQPVISRRTAAKPAAPPAPPAKAEKAAAASPPAKTSKPRRPRTRIQGGSGIVASWFPSENRPRPSSFIPAPPRAESPSLIAAPPASSDRLVHPADLDGAALSIRLFPVRIDIEQSMGRVHISPRPEFIAIRVGEALEWDFRYLAGTDAVVDEVIIDFEKSSPFPKNVMRSRKPGSARPHRQLSGAAASSGAGKTYEYRIRCLSIMKTEVAVARATLVVNG
jgi:hypothetical protein